MTTRDVEGQPLELRRAIADELERLLDQVYPGDDAWIAVEEIPLAGAMLFRIAELRGETLTTGSPTPTVPDPQD